MRIERWIRTVEIKEVREKDVLDIKKDRVLDCFTDYLYHKYASDLIQEELANIAAELSSGSTSTSIVRISKDKGSCAPRGNELLAREHELIQERGKHEEAIEVVYEWLTKIRNPDRKNIIMEYLVNDRGKSVEMVTDLCSASPSDVYKATRRLTKDFARGIPQNVQSFSCQVYYHDNMDIAGGWNSLL